LAGDSQKLPLLGYVSRFVTTLTRLCPCLICQGAAHSACRTPIITLATRCEKMVSRRAEPLLCPVDSISTSAKIALHPPRGCRVRSWNPSKPEAVL
jgi:hypothetical protein